MFQTHTFNSNGHAACRAGAGRDVLRPVRPPRDRRRDTGEVLGPRGLAATLGETGVRTWTLITVDVFRRV